MELQVGIIGQASEDVVLEKTAAAVGSGLLEVYGTPCLVALMELAASQSVLPYLEEGQGTVGTSMNIKHIAATPIGMTVRAESTLVEIDRRRLVFEIKAYDNKEMVGEAVHERFIIDNAKFMAKAEGKKE